jgi:photosystem II stability/assembly factor-like uncharacterized protein
MSLTQTVLIELASLAFVRAGSPPVHSFAIAPGNPPGIYAGTGCAGVFKSVDGGLNWQPANVGLTRLAVDQLAVDPSAPHTVLAGAGTPETGRSSSQFYTYAIFRCVDGGAIWAEWSGKNRKQMEGRAIDSLIFDGTVRGTVHALMRLQYLRSTDSGATWDAPAELTSVHAFALDPSQPPAMFLVTYSHTLSHWDVHRGTLGGKWKALYSDLPDPPGMLIVDPIKPSTLYAAAVWWTYEGRLREGSGPVNLQQLPRDLGMAVDGRKIGRVFKSLDGGVNWLVLKKGLPEGGITDLAIDPTRPEILYAAAPDGAYKTSDGGLTWTRTSEGLVDVRGIRIAIDPANPETLFLGTDFGVFKSTDGAANWRPANQGLTDCPPPAAPPR